MKLVHLRLCNFWSFGASPVEIDLDSTTFLLGPNGAGKTAVLQALARMFSIDPAQRRVRQSDFHVPADEDLADMPESRELWVEVDFEFPELSQDDGKDHDFSAVPGNFAHMRMESTDGAAQMRLRLNATIDRENEIEEKLSYVIRVDENDEPIDQSDVGKHDRNAIQIHYLPARRDPADHISYSANTILGRALRAANWNDQREDVNALTRRITETLVDNPAIEGITQALAAEWNTVHKGQYYTDPSVSFARNDVENLLRHLTVGFTPGHGESVVDFARLSDGQQSLLYLSLVLAMHSIGQKVLSGELETAFDIDKLRPAIFTLIAVEEPENSLSPHFLGRVIRALTKFSKGPNAQAIVATHAPALLRRVSPESIRYLRLDDSRETTVTRIPMPESASVDKFVREGIQAYPELYFSRL